MHKSSIAINLVILNGEAYIQRCLESLSKQTLDQQEIEINILDNGSTDKTIELVENWKAENGNFNITFLKSNINHGMWGGQEELLKQTRADVVAFLSVDVILAPDFLSKALDLFKQHPAAGALQGKIYQFNLEQKELKRECIDTCGFRLFRSRKIVNIGHGEKDEGQYETQQEIFGVEGAVPVFRTAALESIRVVGEIADHDLFWYAEDLDVAWRLRLAGWKQYYTPELIAWHDRQTTKRTRTTFRDFVAMRSAIPLRKRRLEWRNIRCTIIKNDYIINILRDLPYIMAREAAMLLYLLVFETRVLTEIYSLIRLAPRMLRKRRLILSQAKLGPEAIHSYFS